MTKKQKKQTLLRAAERIFEGVCTYSCTAIQPTICAGSLLVQKRLLLREQYADFLGLHNSSDAADFSSVFHSGVTHEQARFNQQLARQLALLLFAETL